MPNCPVCGKEVQASTAYCPACGANLSQPTAGSAMPIGNYGTAYGYQQPGMGMQPGKQRGRHRFVLWIIVAAIIGIIIGGAFVYFLVPVPPDYTDLTGTVTLSSQNHGTPNTVFFNGTTYGSLTSAVLASGSYEVNLPIPDTYSVSIQWVNMTSGPYFGAHNCIASPSTFSSSDQNDTRDFSC